jgi:HSP20 family protein
MTEQIRVKQNGSTALVLHKSSLENFRLPLADVYEKADAFVLSLDLPGATKEAISVTIQGESLAVKVDVLPHFEQGAKVLINECSTSGYFRIFRLGNEIDRDHVEARFDLGVLTVILSKRRESQPRAISIH